MDRLACSFPGAKRAGPSGSSWPRSARPCPPAWACTWSATNLATRKAPVIQEWLARHLPEKKDKILNRIRAMRRGKLNNSEFGLRLRGEGIFAEQISQMFHVACRRAGGLDKDPELSTAFFRRPAGVQLELGLPEIGGACSRF